MSVDRFELSFEDAGRCVDTSDLSISTGDLAPVIRAYIENINRVLQMWWGPACISGLSAEWEKIDTLARLSLLELATPSDLLDVKIPGDPAFEAKVTAEKGRILPRHRGFQINQAVIWRELKGHSTRGPLDEQVFVCLRTILEQMIVGAWTAIETLAGDLWETALNVHPQGLAELRKASDGTLDGEKAVPIPRWVFQRHGFNLQQFMGTALRGRFDFTTVREMRRAYREAFWEHAEFIEIHINDTALEPVAIVRNVIVHRGGVCDEEYEHRAKKHLNLPSLSRGTRIQADGKLVKGLLTPAFSAGFGLIKGVDSWISRKRIEQGGPTRAGGKKRTIDYAIPGWRPPPEQLQQGSRDSS